MYSLKVQHIEQNIMYIKVHIYSAAGAQPNPIAHTNVVFFCLFSYCLPKISTRTDQHRCLVSTSQGKHPIPSFLWPLHGAMEL